MATRHGRIICAATLACGLVLAPIGRLGLPPAAAGTCDGAPDGTLCDDNGDGCFYDDGHDHCLAGVCASPPPCDRTTFAALPHDVVQMDWSKDPTQVTPGEFCEGRGLVTADLVEQLTGVVPPTDAQGFVVITRAKNARKDVPPATGKVRLKLHVNNLGRLLLRARHSSVPLPIRVRMALTKPNGGPTVAANRIVSIVAHRTR